jgi:hypothetical protein
MACSICYDFKSDLVIRNINIAALNASAKAGCPSCSLIKQCLHGMFDDKDILNVTIDTLPSHRGPKSLVRVRLRPNYRPKDPRVGASFDLDEEILQPFILPGNNEFSI